MAPASEVSREAAAVHAGMVGQAQVSSQRRGGEGYSRPSQRWRVLDRPEDPDVLAVLTAVRKEAGRPAGGPTARTRRRSDSGPPVGTPSEARVPAVSVKARHLLLAFITIPQAIL
jgi:hypothetical protein